MWSAITGFFKTISAALGFGEAVVERKNRQDDRKAGADAVRAGDNAEAARVNENVADAALDTDADISKRLRDGNF